MSETFYEFEAIFNSKNTKNNILDMDELTNSLRFEPLIVLADKLQPLTPV